MTRPFVPRSRRSSAADDTSSHEPFRVGGLQNLRHPEANEPGWSFHAGEAGERALAPAFRRGFQSTLREISSPRSGRQNSRIARRVSVARSAGSTNSRWIPGPRLKAGANVLSLAAQAESFTYGSSGVGSLEVPAVPPSGDVTNNSHPRSGLSRARTLPLTFQPQFCLALPDSPHYCVG